MELIITLNQTDCELKIMKTGNVVDSEKFLYYHNLDSELTPLEAIYLKKHGYVIREKTKVYKELLTGLISSIDKLLAKNMIDPVRGNCYSKAWRSKTGTSNGVDVSAIKSYKILGNQGENATSYRIVQSVVEALKLTV